KIARYLKEMEENDRAERGRHRPQQRWWCGGQRAEGEDQQARGAKAGVHPGSELNLTKAILELASELRIDF
ncbi:MAG: hypothetical protein OK455_07560, partial [Thaumarchaeota archaeon]|nr:hypothetical protein [Nitrososphaerota archaeon]